MIQYRLSSNVDPQIFLSTSSALGSCPRLVSAWQLLIPINFLSTSCLGQGNCWTFRPVLALNQLATPKTYGRVVFGVGTPFSGSKGKAQGKATILGAPNPKQRQPHCPPLPYLTPPRITGQPAHLARTFAHQHAPPARFFLLLLLLLEGGHAHLGEYTNDVSVQWQSFCGLRTSLSEFGRSVYLLGRTI